MLPPPRHRRSRSRAALGAFVVALLLHGGIVYYFWSQIRAMVDSAGIFEDVIVVSIESPVQEIKQKVVRKGTPKVEPVATKPPPEAEQYLVTTNAPSALAVKEPPVSASGTGRQGKPEAVSSVGALDNVDFIPLFNPNPTYPEIARSAGIEGYVMVELLIGERGEVLEFKILEVFGHPQFAKETEKVIQRWRFPAPRLRGKPVQLRYVYKVTFKLG